MKKKVKKLAEKICLLFLRENEDAIEKVVLERRQILSNNLDKEFGSVVKYGPLKGFKFTANTWWAGPERGAMLLGLYELEVLESFKDIPSSYNTFINVGAADGYYGVGVLAGNLFQNQYATKSARLVDKPLKKTRRSMAYQTVLKLKELRTGASIKT